MSRAIGAVLCAGVLSLFVAPAARADGTAMQGVGGAVRPMKEHPSVVMDRMLVEADVTPKTARVRCEFTFRNTGRATHVLMGFPESGNSEAKGKSEEPPGFLSFAASVDGRAAQTHIGGFSENEAGRWERWRLWRVSFGEGQTRRVQVRYTSPMSEWFADPDDVGEAFNYAVHTGASWKGRIGYGRVRVHLHYDPSLGRFEVGPSPYDEEHTRQRFFTHRDDEVEWARSDFEPTREDDITAVFHPTMYEVSFGKESYQESLRVDRYLRHGVLMAPADLFAEWCTGVAKAGSAGVTFTRGSRTVTVLPAEIVCPQSPGGMEDKEVLVPLAKVARLLGATVVYDASRRSVQVTFPDQPDTPGRRVLKAGKKIAPGAPPAG